MNTETDTPQIGFLGGTFDPPHFGHINLAISLMEAHGLEEVLFSPAWTSPFKEGRNSASTEHRLRMTALAIEGIPQFRLFEEECLRETLSYTVDTLRLLFAQESQRPQPRRIRLLLGTDTAQELPRWREPEEIVRLAPPLVGCRSVDAPISDAEASPEVRIALERGLTNIPLMDISSTEIRRRRCSGLYNGHLLPAKVVDYIYYHDLYLMLLDGPS